MGEYYNLQELALYILALIYFLNFTIGLMIVLINKNSWCDLLWLIIPLEFLKFDF